MDQLIKLILGTFIILTMVSCLPDKFREHANEQFGDQHFKTAIALIELHKIRKGAYPAKLKDLEYTGDWDQIIFRSVKYKKLDEGYELDLVNGWMGKPQDLTYPDDFWNGLGLRKSNLKKN